MPAAVAGRAGPCLACFWPAPRLRVGEEVLRATARVRANALPSQRLLSDTLTRYRSLTAGAGGKQNPREFATLVTELMASS